MVEAIDRINQMAWRKPDGRDTNEPRKDDLSCYISDVRKFKNRYATRRIKRSRHS